MNYWTKLQGECRRLFQRWVAPFLVAPSRLKFQIKSPASSNKYSGLYHVQTGPETEVSVLCAARIPRKPPPLLQIHHGPLSCFLRLANALGLPTSVLIGQRSIGISRKALEEELQVIHETGDAVASSTVQGCVSRERESNGTLQRHGKKKRSLGNPNMDNPQVRSFHGYLSFGGR